jgi:regulator of replication initiation timing
MLVQLEQLEQRIQQLHTQWQRSEAENQALRQQVIQLREQLRKQDIPLTDNDRATETDAKTSFADTPNLADAPMEPQQLKQTIDAYIVQIEQCMQVLQQY